MGPNCNHGFGDDDHVDYYIGKRLKLERETENSGVSAKKRGCVTAGVLMPDQWPLPALIHWEGEDASMEEMRGASFAGSQRPCLGLLKGIKNQQFAWPLSSKILTSPKKFDQSCIRNRGKI